jgi:hypothetical protein
MRKQTNDGDACDQTGEQAPEQEVGVTPEPPSSSKPVEVDLRRMRALEQHVFERADMASELEELEESPLVSELELAKSHNIGLRTVRRLMETLERLGSPVWSEEIEVDDDDDADRWETFWMTGPGLPLFASSLPEAVRKMVTEAMQQRQAVTG